MLGVPDPILCLKFRCGWKPMGALHSIPMLIVYPVSQESPVRQAAVSLKPTNKGPWREVHLAPGWWHAPLPLNALPHFYLTSLALERGGCEADGYSLGSWCLASSTIS